MLKIRMQRIGRRNEPAYRIVVGEHTYAPQSGKFIERLGSWNPKTKERTLNSERIKYWMSVGAKPSGSVHNMLVSEGVIDAKKINVLPKKTVPAVAETGTGTETPAESPEAVGAETTTEAPGDDSGEAPAEETTTTETPVDEAAASDESGAAEESSETAAEESKET